MLRSLLLVAFLLPTAAWSQTILLRSGEHDSFTRLTIPLTERVPWRVATHERTATLTLQGAPVSLDTSSVFDRISRKRLAGLTASDTGVRLDLACDCEVSGFWHGSSLLVLDIRDRADEAENSTKDASVSFEPYTSRPSPAADLVLRSLDRNTTQNPTGPVADSQGLERSALGQMQNDLLAQLSRAASQGLLEPRESGVIQPSKANPANPRTPAGTAFENLSSAASPRNINLRAETSMDREFVKLFEDQVPELSGSSCISNDMLNVRDWAQETPFWTQIGPLRASLTSEIDEIDANTARDLARIYIHFGFGAEAIAVLNVKKTMSQEALILRDMAAILEFGSLSEAGIFSDQVTCSTSAALWSLLAREDFPSDQPVDKNAVLRAFAALPHHLRVYLGPDLAIRLTRTGDNDTAGQILSMIERGSLPAPPPARLARAEVDLALGLVEPAQATLTEIVESNSEPSVDALIRIVETSIENGEPISFELAQLVGAYAIENRESPLANDLAWATVAALGASAAFDEAIEILEEQGPNFPPDRPDIRSILADQLTETADDIGFLGHVLEAHLGQPSRLSAASANAVAERLLSLGFPDQARSFVASTAAKAGLEQDRQLLRAQAALAINRPRQAEVDLIERTDKAANQLRARARSMIGEHGAAKEFYQSAGQDADAETEAWYDERWSDLATSDDPHLSDLAALLGQDETISGTPSDAGVLSENRALIENSDRMRHTISALLDAREPPVLAEN
ncbi:hypothetical protein [Roseovarius sp.]|jgi:hypothetical protein